MNANACHGLLEEALKWGTDPWMLMPVPDELYGKTGAMATSTGYDRCCTVFACEARTGHIIAECGVVLVRATHAEICAVNEQVGQPVQCDGACGILELGGGCRPAADGGFGAAGSYSGTHRPEAEGRRHHKGKGGIVRWAHTNTGKGGVVEWMANVRCCLFCCAMTGTRAIAEEVVGQPSSADGTDGRTCNDNRCLHET